MSAAGRAHNAMLARGLTGPVKALDAVYLELLRGLLRNCWNALAIGQPDLVSAGNEPQVSALIEGWLKKHGAGQLATLGIVAVSRGAETVSGDAEHDELRPDLDLSFALTTTDGLFPLKVECKILDTSSSRTIAKYGNQGVARFVSGDYGWGRREALMLAYVRDASRLPDTLAAYLADPVTAEQHALLAPVLMVGEDARSCHDRPTLEIDGQPWPMGPIDLWHVWLPSPTPGPST